MPGLLVTNRWLTWDKFEWQFNQLEEAAGGALTRVTTDALSLIGAADLPPVALFMDKDVAAAALLESRGVRCVNAARAIAMCDNKAYTHAALIRRGIPHPDTVIAPLAFRNLRAEEWAESDFVAAVRQRLGFPCVVKHAVGSWGSGVYLAPDEEALITILREAHPASVIAERFIAGSAGRDGRVYMVGREPVAAMRRFGEGGDFRANLTGGGRAESWEPSGVHVDLARRAMDALDLDIAAVDFLEGDTPLIGEVNSNAQFAGLSEVTGVDVAASVISYLKGVGM